MKAGDEEAAAVKAANEKLAQEKTAAEALKVSDEAKAYDNETVKAAVATAPTLTQLSPLLRLSSLRVSSLLRIKRNWLLLSLLPTRLLPMRRLLSLLPSRYMLNRRLPSRFLVTSPVLVQ